MKKDPIFDIETPLLFAHRGGAGEVPESTKEAFSHAIQVGSDILELDVQLTKDSRLVVWHGPKLDNVLIDNVSSSKWLRWFKRKRSIWQFSWDELRDKAWVVEPRFKKLKHMEDPEAGKKEQRQLMLLSEFLDYVNELDKMCGRSIPLNIELKGEERQFVGRSKFMSDGIMEDFISVLNEKGGDRVILVASTKKKVLDKFRAMSGGSRATSVSLFEQLSYLDTAQRWLCRTMVLIGRLVKPFLKNSGNLSGRAFQTSYCFVSRQLVKELQVQRVPVHAFLSRFSKVDPLINGNMSEPQIKKEIQKLLDLGISGIMTDFPQRVGKAMEKRRLGE